MRHQKKYSLSVTALIIIFSCSAPPAPPTANLRPIAEAGPNQSVAIRSLVVINGGNSADPDEGPDPLAYAWKAAESNPTEVVVSMSGAKFEFTPIKTGNYVFENEWQTFRGVSGDKDLILKTSEKEVIRPVLKIAVKVVDIFGNDTMRVKEVEM